MLVICLKETTPPCCLSNTHFPICLPPIVEPPPWYFEPMVDRKPYISTLSRYLFPSEKACLVLTNTSKHTFLLPILSARFETKLFSFSHRYPLVLCRSIWVVGGKVCNTAMVPSSTREWYWWLINPLKSKDFLVPWRNFEKVSTSYLQGWKFTSESFEVCFGYMMVSVNIRVPWRVLLRGQGTRQSSLDPRIHSTQLHTSTGVYAGVHAFVCTVNLVYSQKLL